MATPRRLLVDPAKTGVFHCVSRCVRRAFLCGRDPYSGQDYEHRRAWIRDRLQELTGLFAMEVHAYAVMSNHLELLDWTGRQIRADKRGHLSPDLRPVLERLDLDVETWVENVERYGGLFYRLAGKLKRLDELARATDRAWLHGHRGARRLYAEAG